MSRAIPADQSVQPAGTDGQNGDDELLGIGAAASRCGVSERALRYYQQIGLITPCGCTPGGMRRYSRQDLDRVTRIKQLQTVLGFNLDEVAIVLRNEDRMAEIRDTYYREQTSDRHRQELAAESLELQQQLRATVEAKRAAIEEFVADLDGRIGRTRDVLRQMTAAVSRQGPTHEG
jgi:MerR family transcriptional regulator, repressor of the yfmOP operon